MKLVSLSDYVNELYKEHLVFCCKEGLEYLRKIISYNDFLNRPLELGMFVPCNEDGNVLEEPHNMGLLHQYPTGQPLVDHSLEVDVKYNEAKERVLFEEFYFVRKSEQGYYSILLKDGYSEFILDPKKTIQSLVDKEVVLTQSAIKQLTQ